MPLPSHLALVRNRDTGLFHGALHRNHPTPSGCDRFLLALTTDEGYSSRLAAAEAINKAFPDLHPLDMVTLVKEEESYQDAQMGLPKGAWLTRILPRGRNKREPGVPEVEIKLDGKITGTLSLAQLRLLVERGIARLDSGSGDDPNLYYQYDHFLVV
jgi:hypothetical protein